MSVFERINKKGEKEYYFRFKIDGHEYYKTVKEATSKSDAEKAEAVVKSDLLRGTYSLAEGRKGTMLFAKLVEKYKEYAKNNKRIWKTEQGKVDRIAEYFKGKRLKDITPAVIEEFKTYRKNSISKRGTITSGATVNRDLALIKRMFSIAVNNGYIDINPALNCKVPMFQENNEIIRYLSNEEEQNLIQACTGEYYYLKPIILTALQSGLRYGELINLKWNENIDLKNCLITLTKDMTKSKKKRCIPISSILLEEYEKLSKKKTGDYLFANPKTGKPYGTIRKAWITVKAKAKIDPEFRFHDLRHSFATKLMDNNVNVGVIKDLLGHSTLNITQKYAHAKDNTKRMAVEVLAVGYK